MSRADPSEGGGGGTRTNLPPSPPPGPSPRSIFNQEQRRVVGSFEAVLQDVIDDKEGRIRPRDSLNPWAGGGFEKKVDGWV